MFTWLEDKIAKCVFEDTRATKFVRIQSASSEHTLSHRADVGEKPNLSRNTISRLKVPRCGASRCEGENCLDIYTLRISTCDLKV